MPNHVKIIGQKVHGLWIVWLEALPQVKFEGLRREVAVKKLRAHYGEHLFNSIDGVVGDIEDDATEFTLAGVVHRKIPAPSEN